ncbi:hypothetical protein [Clostridium paraputrificum]|uniref:hypothetical protein n=1 Tax=Clostridium paraputrificum TaxID=29363 RepID=UPI00189E0932|nr:hypothetical protein [Clostridium paraputrificum]MDU4787676.1 hypothetical protein [Clostridium sp.]
MINEIYVISLANYIKNGVINPKTNNPFCLEDIKKDEYIAPVLEKIKEMGEIQDEATSQN